MSVNRLGLNRGHEKQFMQVGWRGDPGRIVMAIGSYALGLLFAWMTGAPTGVMLGLAVPFAIGVYFIIRPPISIFTVAALAALAISGSLVLNHYAEASPPSSSHKAEDHVKAPSGMTWEGFTAAVSAGGGSALTRR